MEQSEHQPDLLALLAALGNSLLGMTQLHPLDIASRTRQFETVVSDFSALSAVVSTLAHRLADEYDVTEEHRNTAALLLTAICSPEVPTDVINETITDMRNRGAGSPEEAHLVIVGMLDIIFFLARALNGRGVDGDEVIRQAIFRANHEPGQR